MPSRSAYGGGKEKGKVGLWVEWVGGYPGHLGALLSLSLLATLRGLKQREGEAEGG